ncbi:baseplate wedge protein [Escherichia phage vB_EcoM_4HA13]|uniref:Baseplate wedge protein n=1 Tax=Escherichia phage vB_EcoM_4HA13 TaxID=2601675 RepID=A0A7D0JHK4_9CAUD|nr:baseplate wedge subunit [Escherichia phage vB_EcoM_4HA13]QEM43048.1 baseplate wedge protein [Escherichia phage vB_EcoM_4HA13]
MATIQYGVTTNGFVRKPINAILTSLNNKFIAAFGTNFDVSPESPDGQVIGIITDEVDQCWNQSQQVFNAYRPGAMSGVGLDNICELTGVVRYVNTKTRVTVYCDGTSGSIVPAGSVVGDGTMTFTLDTDVVLPGDVTAVADVAGAYYVAPGTINKIITEGISGWTSVTNADSGTTGVTYETDPEFRARRDKTTAILSSATVESIYAALSDLNLTYIRIRDNDSGAAIGAQPAGTVFVVVDGGSKNDIARRIYSVKTGGVPTFGTESITIMDSKGYPHPINFSRSSNTEIFVTGTFKRRASANISSNDAAKTLQEVMINYLNSLQPGEDVIWSELFKPLMDATSYIEIDSLFIGTTANPTGIASIELDIDKRAHGIEANIKFTDVTT